MKKANITQVLVAALVIAPRTRNKAMRSVIPGRDDVHDTVGVDKFLGLLRACELYQDLSSCTVEHGAGKSVPTSRNEIKEFLKKHGVESVVATESNMGCPHEEGEDFPHGEDGPFFPWWKGKQGSAKRD